MWAPIARGAGGLVAAVGAAAASMRFAQPVHTEGAETSGRWGGIDWSPTTSAKKTMDGWAVRAADLNKLVVKILLAAGSDQSEAEIVANNLVESNLKGHDSHGVGYLTRYIPGIQSGLLKVNQHAKPIAERGAFVLVDGDLGFGQVIGKEAMEIGIAKAKTHGVAVVGVRNSHHLARIGKWAEMAAEQGLISIHFTNVAGHDPLVAPFLGTDARLGTNPFTIGFPGFPNGQPVILDYATSELALGKVREYMTAGKPLRPGVLLDKDGNHTTDSSCLPPHHGALLPFGSTKSGYKGYGLALMCELIGGVLTGGYTIEPSHFRSEKTIVNSMTAIIIDPAFMGVGSAEELLPESTRLFDYVRSSPTREDDTAVEVPGEMELHYYATRTEQGIPMTQGSVNAIVANAVKVGISADEARAILGGTPAKLAEDRYTRFSLA